MNSVRDSIHESILSILEAQDASHPQFPTAYYLDPIEARVYWETQIGPGIPRLAHEGIWVRVFVAPAKAIPQSIVEALLGIADCLVRDCEQFQADNGWENKPDYLMEFQFEISTFWDPEDWFDVWDLQEIREKWEQGMSVLEILSGLHLGDATTGMVDREQAVEWLESKIKEWQEEAAE